MKTQKIIIFSLCSGEETMQDLLAEQHYETLLTTWIYEHRAEIKWADAAKILRITVDTAVLGLRNFSVYDDLRKLSGKISNHLQRLERQEHFHWPWNCRKELDFHGRDDLRILFYEIWLEAWKQAKDETTMRAIIIILWSIRYPFAWSDWVAFSQTNNCGALDIVFNENETVNAAMRQFWLKEIEFTSIKFRYWPVLSTSSCSFLIQNIANERLERVYADFSHRGFECTLLHSLIYVCGINNPRFVRFEESHQHVLFFALLERCGLDFQNVNWSACCGQPLHGDAFSMLSEPQREQVELKCQSVDKYKTNVVQLISQQKSPVFIKDINRLICGYLWKEGRLTTFQRLHLKTIVSE